MPGARNTKDDIVKRHREDACSAAERRRAGPAGSPDAASACSRAMQFPYLEVEIPGRENEFVRRPTHETFRLRFADRPSVGRFLHECPNVGIAPYEGVVARIHQKLPDSGLAKSDGDSQAVLDLRGAERRNVLEHLDPISSEFFRGAQDLLRFRTR